MNRVCAPWTFCSPSSRFEWRRRDRPRRVRRAADQCPQVKAGPARDPGVTPRCQMGAHGTMSVCDGRTRCCARLGATLERHGQSLSQGAEVTSEADVARAWTSIAHVQVPCVTAHVPETPRPRADSSRHRSARNVSVSAPRRAASETVPRRSICVACRQVRARSRRLRSGGKVVVAQALLRSRPSSGCGARAAPRTSVGAVAFLRAFRTLVLTAVRSARVGETGFRQARAAVVTGGGDGRA